ncbi:MAG: hypothetical protein ACP5N3_01020 [Candidatus Nanoarchaeia archaeon]
MEEHWHSYFLTRPLNEVVNRLKDAEQEGKKIELEYGKGNPRKGILPEVYIKSGGVISNCEGWELPLKKHKEDRTCISIPASDEELNKFIMKTYSLRLDCEECNGE